MDAQRNERTELFEFVPPWSHFFPSLPIITCLEQSEGIADSVALVGSESGRVDGWVYVNDLLEECGDGPEGVPEQRSQVRDRLTLLAVRG